MNTSKAIIGNFVRKLILAQEHTPAEIVAMTLVEFPDSACDEKHVAWYKWDLKRNDLLPKGFKMPSGRKPKNSKPAPVPAPAPVQEVKPARRKRNAKKSSSAKAAA